ncbi:MAG: ATP-binding protein [Burkholderiales bacterium]
MSPSDDDHAVQRIAAAERRAAEAEAALARLHDALNELPCGLEIYDTDDRLIFFNSEVAALYPWIHFERQIGRSFEQILRESIDERRIPSAVGREEKWLKERLARRGLRDGPVLQSLKDGKWINTYERRSRSNYVVGVRLEVTDLVSKTRELHESRDRLQAIISSAAAGIVIADVQGVVVEANAATFALFDAEPDEVIGQPLAALIPGLAPALDAAAQATAAPGQAAAHAEVEATRSDGRALQLHASVAQIGAGDARQFAVIISDITERAEAERARRILEAQLREAQKIESIGTLASGIAHDFNNVLGSILGNAELASQDIAQGHADRALQGLSLVRRAAERARNLVRQILTFGRSQSAQRSVQALQPIVEEALNILRATLPARVALDTRFSAASLHVLADAIQIEQVVLNLCTNAWQAMDEAGGRIEVGIDVLEASGAQVRGAAARDIACARLWVADDGAGMDEATRLRLFDPFFTTKPLGIGTGLGLSVVHGIVKSHEGVIDVASTPGRGTRFDLTLPLVPAPPVHVAPPAPPAIDVRGGGERVMYLDDDDVMPLMVENLLQRLGYVVHSFSDPRMALDALRARPEAFDLVVTDFNMPGLTGLDVVRALAGIRPALPTVLTSGLVSDELRAQARALGVCEVLEKQNTLEELAAVVKRALAPSNR